MSHTSFGLSSFLQHVFEAVVKATLRINIHLNYLSSYIYKGAFVQIPLLASTGTAIYPHRPVFKNKQTDEHKAT